MTMPNCRALSVMHVTKSRAPHMSLCPGIDGSSILSMVSTEVGVDYAHTTIFAFNAAS